MKIKDMHFMFIGGALHCAILAISWLIFRAAMAGEWSDETQQVLALFTVLVLAASLAQSIAVLLITGYILRHED